MQHVVVNGRLRCTGMEPLHKWPSLTVFHQDPATPRASPAHSPPENGIDKTRPPKKDTPNSPASVASSGSTPSSKAKELGHVSHQELRTN